MRPAGLPPVWAAGAQRHIDLRDELRRRDCGTPGHGALLQQHGHLYREWVGAEQKGAEMDMHAPIGILSASAAGECLCVCFGGCAEQANVLLLLGRRASKDHAARL